MKETDCHDECQFKSLDDTNITEEIRLRAEKELNETEEIRKKCLEEMKVLIKEEDDLIADVSDEFLLQFLRVRKFKTNVAFSLLKRYYEHRLLYPSIYRDYSPRQNLKVLNANLLNFLPLRTADDCAIWVSRIGLWNPEEFDLEPFLRVGLLCHEKALMNPVTQISGIVNIADFEGLSWTHIFHMSASFIKCFVRASQDSFPIRHKAVHVINNPSIFGIFFSLLKPFLSSKIRSRIHIHGYNLNSLHQYVPPSLLPEEFGGTQGAFRNDKFYNSLLESENEFLDKQKYGYKMKNIK